MTNSKDNSINNVYDKDLDALIEGLKVYQTDGMDLEQERKTEKYIQVRII